MVEAVKPECKEVPWSGGDTVNEYTHDAFGMIGMSIATGGQTMLF